MSINNVEWHVSKEPVHFAEAISFMQKRVDEIIAGTAPEMIWILEHHPVYTAGISANDADLLAKTDIPIFKTNRGGKYTYHCPGMKIIYVMLDLRKFFAPEQPDVARFVEFLENWVIKILADFGIKAGLKKGMIGIWAGDKKISALGIKLKKWVSYHGIAINISPDLAGFQHIIPCGIKEFGVTSMQEILGEVSEKNLLKSIRRHFEDSRILLLNS